MTRLQSHSLSINNIRGSSYSPPMPAGYKDPFAKIQPPELEKLMIFLPDF
jgi:hypothetical protein